MMLSESVGLTAMEVSLCGAAGPQSVLTLAAFDESVEHDLELRVPTAPTPKPSTLIGSSGDNFSCGTGSRASPSSSAATGNAVATSNPTSAAVRAAAPSARLWTCDLVGPTR